MKKVSYSFDPLLQTTIALVTLVLNLGIPYLIGEPANLITAVSATIGVFIASGLRFC